MEITSISSFLEYYERVRERTLKLIIIIPSGNMGWAYMPGKYSIADMIRHIGAMERNMFAENVMLRQSRFAGCGKDLAEDDKAIEFLNEMHRQSVQIFSSLTDSDLQRKCPNPGGEIVTWKWLRAMVEHEIHHRGELYIYLNLLGLKTPPIFGLSAEEVQNRSI